MTGQTAREIASRIRELRVGLKYSYQELANRTHMSKSTLQRYETGGIKNIPLDKLKVLAEALETTPAYLMDWEQDEDARRLEWLKAHGTPYTPDKYYAPVLGSVRAGLGGLAVQEIIGQEPIPEQYAEDGEEYFWLIVDGDSMAPLLESGDHVLLRAQRSVDSGTLAVVIVGDEEGVIKKVYYGPDWIELRSVNPHYPPRRFEGANVEEICVMGKVMKSERQY